LILSERSLISIAGNLGRTQQFEENLTSASTRRDRH
jgi:hypothetical protein